MISQWPAAQPRWFGAIPGYSGKGIVRNLWKRPSQLVGQAEAWCCQCVEDESAVEWDEAMAPYILREPEWRIWNSISRTAARRRWLRGRLAAKDAVRLLLWGRFGILSPLESISILPDAHGQPHAIHEAPTDAESVVSVSISHCANTSVALAVECTGTCRSVGIDLASPGEDHDGLREGGFSVGEIALLDSIPICDQQEWLLRLWCAKEAVGKALGVGLQGDPLNFAVRRLSRARGTVEVEINVNRDSVFPHEGPARMTAHVGSGRGLTFAVARLMSSMEPRIPGGDIVMMSRIAGEAPAVGK